jgi:hypothetical protein
MMLTVCIKNQLLLLTIPTIDHRYQSSLNDNNSLTSEHQNFQLPKENVHNKKSSLNPSEKYIVIGPMHIVLNIHNKNIHLNMHLIDLILKSKKEEVQIICMKRKCILLLI